MTTGYPSPLGQLVLDWEGEALTRMVFQETPLPLPPEVRLAPWLDAYFSGRDPGPVPVALAPAGTPFRQQVWALVGQIPYGETRSYGQLAGQLAALQGKARSSPRAVGQAVGANPLWLVVPCHRVVGADGSLTGYAGGLARKAALLQLEEGGR